MGEGFLSSISRFGFVAWQEQVKAAFANKTSKFLFGKQNTNGVHGIGERFQPCIVLGKCVALCDRRDELDRQRSFEKATCCRIVVGEYNARQTIGLFVLKVFEERVDDVF